MLDNILGLKKNLISVCQFDSKGYATEFGKGSWKIVKGAMVVAVAQNLEPCTPLQGVLTWSLLLKVLPVHVCGTADLDT